MGSAVRGVWRPSVTVVIPTLNGAEFLDEVLSALEGQRHVGSLEILVVDSGSFDDTLDIVARYPSVTLRHIPKREFGHGRTRQKAAEWAKGEVVAYLTQDATPASPRWLCDLVAPLADPEVAGVVGRQIPRPGCVPLIKYDIERVFRDPPTDFYSDTNSAARKATLLGPVPYRDVDFSEDYAFAQDAIRAGMRIAYAPTAAVLHSNEVSVRGYVERMRAEVRGHAAAGVPLPRYSALGATLRAVRGMLTDSGRILLDTDYGLRRSLYWLVKNPAYHVARWRGIYLGGKEVASARYARARSTNRTE